ncbi:MAG TPA: ATP phosphoribosyltransferase [Thermomicrobiales bacterium]|nr:ATP phosphoribosyltransferase [Thermomicrobiales bacterium]
MTSARSLINGENQLKLAIQRSGRLTDHSLDLLRQIGLEFESYGQRLFSKARNFPLSILYARDDDIPDYVGLSTVDLGIVGRNLVHEQGIEVVELLSLGYGYCSLVVAVPGESAIETPDQLLNSRIATSYPESARKFFASIGGSPEIITISGSVEVAPALGIADAIVELTATGSSLQLNDLRPIHTILESEAVLIANRESMENPARRENIDRIVMRMKAVYAARRFKYVMMNAPEANLDEIRAVLPGLKAPTVIPLEIPGWVAVHAAIQEDVFWEKIEQLRHAGASEILVSALDKLLL